MRSAFLPLLLALLPSTLASQALPGDAFGALKARSVGPAGMSGRITAIDAVESDPDIIYAGAATGGLWKSANGGQTWTPVFDDQPVLGIGSVAVFQADPDIVWVGTGEGDPRNSAGVGAGLYKSTDGGDTWTFLGLERSERIQRIVLHPSSPDVAYVGVMGPAWSDGQERGVYRTRDGGATWERVLYVDERTGVADLVMDPGHPDHLLASMWEFRRWPWYFESGGPGSGLYRSEDGGDSWVQVTAEEGLPSGELGRIGLAVARRRPQVVYALVEARSSALLRSDDGGVHWRTVNDEEGIAPRPFYYGQIAADPEDDLRLYNLHSRLMLSMDGGETFRNLTGDVHSDFHALWIAPSDSRLLYAGTDGGVYISRDGGDHWQFVDGLPVGQFYHVSVDQEIPFNIYGGMQDNGSWRGPSDLWEKGGIRNYHWQEVGFGDGFGTLIDPSDPTSGYSMSQAGGLVRFDLRTGERKGIRPWAPEGVQLRFNWNAPIAIDPFDPETFYFGSQFVHRTTSRGTSWEIISGDLTTNDPEKQRQGESGGLTRDNTGAENYTTLLTIAPSPVERETIWTGSDDGLVYLTRSGGGDWEEVGRRIRGVPENTWIPHIEASKHTAGTAYVVFDDHRRGNWDAYIFRTEDYGRRWSRVADQDDIRGFVHTVVEDPVTPNLLFAGSEFGLYVSLNRGEDWIPWRHGIPAVPVRSLVVHPRDLDLVVGTHGRGIYVLDDIRPLEALAGDPRLLERPVHLFEPPPAILHGVEGVAGYHFPADALFRGEPRPVGAILTYSVGAGGAADAVQVEIVDTDGVLVRRLEGPATPGLNRVVWDLTEAGPLPGGGGGGAGPEAQGLEVLPGPFEVRVRLGEVESTGTLEVLPDPRVEISLEDRILRRNLARAALSLVGALQEVQAGLDVVMEGVDRWAGSQAGVGQDLRTLGDSVRAEARRIGGVASSMAGRRRDLVAIRSPRDAPTESERITLIRARDEVDRLVSMYNALVWGRVTELNEALTAAGLEGFSVPRAIPRTYGGSGGGR